MESSRMFEAAHCIWTSAGQSQGGAAWISTRAWNEMFSRSREAGEHASGEDAEYAPNGLLAGLELLTMTYRA